MGQLEQVQKILAAGNWAFWKSIAAASGVPLSTIKRIGYGTTKNPSSLTVDRIAAVVLNKRKAA